MGPECGSWGVPARGTSKRTYCNAFGAMHIPFVADANHCVAKKLDRIHRYASNYLVPPDQNPTHSLWGLCYAYSSLWQGMGIGSWSNLLNPYWWGTIDLRGLSITLVMFLSPPWFEVIIRIVLEPFLDINSLPHDTWNTWGLRTALLDAIIGWELSQADSGLLQCPVDHDPGFGNLKERIPPWKDDPWNHQCGPHLASAGVFA